MATAKPFNLRKQCVGQKKEVLIQIVPPYTAVELESGCRALADVIELPIYFKRRQEYQVVRESRITSPPKHVKMSELTIWKPVSDKGLDVVSNIMKLGDIQDRPIEDLVHDIENLQQQESFEFPDNIMTYALIGLIVIAIVGILYILHCKRKAILCAIVSKAEQTLKQKEYERPLITTPDRHTEYEMPMMTRPDRNRDTTSHQSSTEVATNTEQPIPPKRREDRGNRREPARAVP